MATATKTAPKRVNLKEVEKGDVFSEISHYIYEGSIGDRFAFKHLESGEVINLDKKYVENLLVTADQFHQEIEVGKEDKYWTEAQITAAVTAKVLSANHTVRVGDVRVPGIRSIWSDIYSSDVLTVCYTKQGKNLSKKKYSELLAAQETEALAIIERAKASKKNTTEAAKEALKFIQSNPISDFEEGEERTLRGYKIQFNSPTGFYDVIDMDITDANNVRKVNINEIKWLVLHGVKYVVV